MTMSNIKVKKVPTTLELHTSNKEKENVLLTFPQDSQDLHPEELR